MVAKRDLAPHFSSQVPKQAMRSHGRKYGRNDVVNMHSRGNPLPDFNGANTYSDAVAHNVQRRREQFCRTKATESIIVIAVNVALSLAAIAAIAKLLPYQSSQKGRLDELTTEVNSVEQRVNGMREKLPQTLSTGKSQEMSLRKQGWIKNNQMTIKLLDPSEVASPNTDDIMPTTTTAQKFNNH